MTLAAAARFRQQRLVECAQVARPDVSREVPEVLQRLRFVEQEFHQTPVSLAQIAGGTGRHYVAAGAVAAARQGLDVVHRQRGGRELLTAVGAAPRIPLEDLLASHDGRVS